MNVREAIVLRVEGRDAVVRVARQNGCGRCSEAGGCGTSLMGQLFGQECSTYRAPNVVGAQPGDAVEVSVPDRGPLTAALLVYVLPLAGLLGGALLGQILAGGDGAIALGGLAGLVAGFGAGLGWSRRARTQRLLSVALVVATSRRGEDP